MIKTKRYCDHCGKELDKMKDYDDTLITISYKEAGVDLCSECFDELCDTVIDFCKPGGAKWVD